uniref:Immunoglobulin V-set domain-containing protein n=1 Tax=Equus caballus TaxID=9796 RepID=A0A9L0T3M4_HORSE
MRIMGMLMRRRRRMKVTDNEGGIHKHSYTNCIMFPGPKNHRPVDAKIYQMPAFLLTGVEQDVTLECKQNLEYNDMYQCRKDPGQGLRLIYYSQVVNYVHKGDVPEGHAFSREETEMSPLTVRLAHINQTGLHLYSGSTAESSTATVHLCTNLLQPCSPSTASILILG